MKAFVFGSVCTLEWISQQYNDDHLKDLDVEFAVHKLEVA